MEKQITVNSEQEMLDIAAKLSKEYSKPVVIYLSGDLGAGKTTFTRGFLRGLGYNDKVKSPTFTLVEEYSLSDFFLFHFDLYRLGSPQELDFIGINDYFTGENYIIIEWPEKGVGILPKPDIQINISGEGEYRELKIIS